MTSAPVNLEDIECFVALAEHEHFGRAAEQLGMSVSAMSKRCAHLENALGIRLFNRSSRRVALTQEGAMLVEPARRILSGEMGIAVDDADTGEHVVGTQDSVAVMESALLSFVRP